MIYENVKRLCDNRGISIRKLEQDIGMGNATIRGWQWRTPRIDTLKKVADYFNVTVDELTGGITPEQEVIEMAKKIYEDEKLSRMFELTKKLSKEDLGIVIEVAKRMHGDEND